MATLAVLGQQSFSYDGFHFVITKVRIQSSSDTVSIPTGTTAASALGSSDFAVSVSAGTAVDTATITGGDASTGVLYVCSRHSGSAGGMGASS